VVVHVDAADEGDFGAEEVFDLGGDGISVTHAQRAVDTHRDVDHQVGAEAVGQDLFDVDLESLASLVDHFPFALAHGERARWSHPVEWLVGTAVGVDQHASVGLDHEQTNSTFQSRGEPTGVGDAAAGDDQTH
jgi:hypothetical protein